MDGFFSDAKTMPCPSFRFEVSRFPRIRKLKQLMKFHPQKNTPPWGCAIFPGRSSFLLVWKNQFGIQVKVGLEKHLHFILEKLVIFRPPNSRADIWSGQSTTGGRFLTIQFLQHMKTHTHTQMSHEGNDLRQMPDVYKNQLYIKLSLWWTQQKYLHRWMVFLRKCHTSPNRVFFCRNLQALKASLGWTIWWWLVIPKLPTVWHPICSMNSMFALQVWYLELVVSFWPGKLDILRFAPWSSSPTMQMGEFIH